MEKTESWSEKPCSENLSQPALADVEQEYEHTISKIESWSENPKVKLGELGAQPALTDVEQEFQHSIHRFASEVMRPIGAELDKLSPEDVIGENSAYWDFRRKYLELGIDLETLGSLTDMERGKMFPLIYEELGWGDAGLAISTAAAILPQYLALMFNNTFLMERFSDSMIGCWAITEPDHGSDSLDVNGQIFHAQGKYGRPNCVATIKGDEVVINGQKSAWVSNGTIAEVCILYCAADSGHGAETNRGCCILVPMDHEGVSRGKPLDKLGQRALSQGEVFFDNVNLPTEYILADPDMFKRAVYAIHSEANSLMGSVFTGVARAAFELAHAYAHERKQGGVPIIRHQSVQQRLFHMFRKVEASRALSQRVYLYNQTVDTPALHAGMTAKITATQTAFEVCSDALQIFGGNGLTREYPMEKLLRDARASLIEDGCNEVLSIKGGCYLIDEELIA